MPAENITLFVAFAAGLLSFLSPCVLPLVPGYIGHLVGVTARANNHGKDSRETPNRPDTRLHALAHAATFVLGFTLIFVTFWTSLSMLGQFLPDYMRYVRPLGGIILILLGLNMTGMLQIALFDRTLKLPKREGSPTPGLPASFFTGVVFAVGWTPCIGPVLGGIIGLASESSTSVQGTFLLVAYALGLGVPFILCALALGQADGLLRRINRTVNGLHLVSVISGLFVIGIGLLMLTNVFQTLPQYFNWLPL